MSTLISILSVMAALGATEPGSWTWSGTNVVTGAKEELAVSQARFGTVVMFLGVKCPCSNGHLMSLSDLARQWSARGFKFVAVHANHSESVESARNHFGPLKLSFPVLRDENCSLADRLGALKTPHVFVLNPRGEVLYSGSVDDSRSGADPKENYLGKALAAVADGKKPNPSEVRSLGCRIDRP